MAYTSDMYKQHITFYKYFVDDIFFAWHGNETQLDRFVRFLDNTTGYLTFSPSYSKEEINFLDVNVNKNIFGNISTRIHRKDCRKNNILHRSSMHPRHITKNIVTNQVLRCKRLHTDREELTDAMSRLTTEFVERGYKRVDIDRVVAEADLHESHKTKPYYSDEHLMNVPPDKQGPSLPVNRSCLTFFNDVYKTCDIIKKNWSILLTDPEISRVVGSTPSFSFKNSKNLKKKLCYKQNKTCDSFVSQRKGEEKYGVGIKHKSNNIVHKKKITERFRVNIYQFLHAMVFAVEEINSNPSLLPNITLGMEIYDSCGVAAKAIEATMWQITGQEHYVPNYRCRVEIPLAAIIGDAASKNSIPMAQILGCHDYPQISYGSTVALLSDKKRFPSFLRTAPSDTFQSLGVAQLLTQLGWTWVGIMADENDYGQQGSQIVKEELLKSGACIAFFENLPIVYEEKRARSIINTIKRSTANVILVFSGEDSIISVMEEIAKQNITNKVWIGTDGWYTSAIFSNNLFWETLNGSIGFLFQKGNMPHFDQHLQAVHPLKYPNDIFIKEFWDNTFNCKWISAANVQTTKENVTEEKDICKINETLHEVSTPFLDVSRLTFVYNVYKAVYAVAYAIHDMETCAAGERPLENRTCTDIHQFEPWQLLHYLRNVQFRTSVNDEIFFDTNGDPPARYDIFNWQVNLHNVASYMKVGSYDSSASAGQKLMINTSIISWKGGSEQVPRSVCSESCPKGYRKSPQQGQPKCCFNCVQCPEGEIANQTDMNECLKCPFDYWSNEKRDACYPKPVEYLSYKDPLGATLASISTVSSLMPLLVLIIFIKNRDTPIVKANNREISYILLWSLSVCFLSSLIFVGQPTNITCMLRQAAFGIVFALSVSCVLAKTIMVVIAFNATKPNSNLRKWVGLKLPAFIVFISTLVQVVLSVIWLSQSPPVSECNMTIQAGLIIIECKEGSIVAFWCVLGYLGLMASISFIVAFLARKLPDSFNEAQFITFSMLVFVSVWLSFIPAYLSTKGKYTVAVEIFAILASSAGVLTCIFIPKCYIILLRPDMNTREYLMGKGAERNKKHK
ncbi:vomeronasal type-2 receptor 1-like [Protopterus annectens]|uniref:vomeronasal type-2 receptor 1-like n=1 Tax=Protopterus annectens TaxID=7888 RepID=UPI001CFC223D|nr:vomeronasal type-2 receptor 1-like [Protopterus annectens]